MWTAGMCVPLVLLGYALNCIATRRALTLNLNSRGMQYIEPRLLVEIYNAHAVTFGCVLLSLAMFGHFHWFWGIHPKLWQHHELGKGLALICLILALVAHAFTMLTQS